MTAIANTTDTPTKVLEPFQGMRVYDWEARINKLLGGYQKAHKRGQLTFSWDPQIRYAENCVTLCSKGVEAVTGVDLHTLMVAEEGYSDRVSAYRLLREYGCSSVEGLLQGLFPSKPNHLAQLGDLVLVYADLTQSETLKAGGIAAPPYFYIITPDGLGKGLIKDVLHVYSVGWGDVWLPDDHLGEDE